MSTAASNRSTILRAFGTLLALALLIYLLSQQGWSEIKAAIRLIPPWRFILAMCIMLISRFSIIARWHTLLRSSGVKIRFPQSVRITFAGLFSTNFLPTTVGGDIIRLAGAIQSGFDATICAASLVVDRLVGMAGMAMAVPFGLPAILVARSMPDQASRFPIFLSALLMEDWLKNIWRKSLDFVEKVFAAISLWLKQPFSLLASLAWSWLHMVCLFSVLYLLFNGMKEAISIWTIGGLYSLAYFITLIPISINGYGLQEISMTLIFANLGQVSMSSALSVALLFRTLMILASLPGALFVPDLLAIKEKIAHEES
ncbi:MAG: flippase-like domain-containing protein [Anaerolineales bacterium]|nr:flippase-like domain-containing protein [Anaerolineales bacterium]